MFSKRHYEDIAEVLRVTRNRIAVDTTLTVHQRTLQQDALTRVENEFIDMFEQDNSRFNKNRFLTWIAGLTKQSK